MDSYEPIYIQSSFGDFEERFDDAGEHQSAIIDDADFDVIRDIDTVLFFRLNSFMHSVSDRELDRSRRFQLSAQEDANKQVDQLANDERSEYAAGKINFFFHQLKKILSPQQQEEVH